MGLTGRDKYVAVRYIKQVYFQNIVTGRSAWLPKRSLFEDGMGALRNKAEPDCVTIVSKVGFYQQHSEVYARNKANTITRYSESIGRSAQIIL